jgi:pimeloyl-ACP methyl ester carboxylesterase
MSTPADRSAWQDTGALTGTALGGVVRIVADTHMAISARVDAALPAPAKPFNRLHASGARTVYGIVEYAHRRVPQAAATVAQTTGTEPTATGVGKALHPVINGFHGDFIAQEHLSLTIPMSLRVKGRDADVAMDFPDATGHLVVFVHGLAEDENAWSLGGRPSYGERLCEAGMTPLFVRYTSGRHISDNGRQLSDLLDEVVRSWPVPVESISLVGHSMGGLVARSACHCSGSWTSSVRTVVTLGTPHRGAPLEKAVHVIDAVMRRVPEAEPIGRILATRSVGIKDLRYGSLVEDDWREQDVDAFLAKRCAEVPFLSHATYYWVASTISKNPDHPFGRLIGDGMVRYPSASAVNGEGLHLGGINHVDLLNDERVFEALRGWLSGDSPTAR